MQGEANVSELILLDGLPSARLTCAAGLIPVPGQYLLAHAAGSEAPLATVLFAAGILPDGFVAAPPIPSTWAPGRQLHVRGPLGHGFTLPSSARRVALIGLECSPRILLSLLEPAFRQGASVALVAPGTPEDLPLQVEVQLPHALLDVCSWADFIAFDAPRESLPGLKQKLKAARSAFKAKAQILVRTPMPCGALAACGVCTVDLGGEALLVCEDGPVFDFRQWMG